jgi:hypothetical protein
VTETTGPAVAWSRAWRRLLAVVVVALLIAHIPRAATAQVAEGAPPAPTIVAGPVVGGVALETTTAAGRPLHYDRDVPPATVGHVATALADGLEAVPRLTGLPPAVTPIAVHVLADRERFRLALAELAHVRVELVGQQTGGYAIERGGTMLLFFPAREVETPADARLALAHELAHLAVREASARRPVPQWFNEGYAQWTSQAALGEAFPEEAAVQRAIDRAAVASGLHSRGGLLPWSELVTRARFSRAGTEGLTFLAYGQSTLFVDWLARRHGREALAEFLLAIGRGSSATPAFESALGPFGPRAAAFEASVRPLAAELGPGLRVLSPRIRTGRAASLAVVGGPPGERVEIQVSLEGGAVRRGERALDAAGFLLLSLDGPATAEPAPRQVTLTSGSLGTMTAILLVEDRDDDGPRPIPAPVQLPRARWTGARAA